jgi:hypothetical protein
MNETFERPQSNSLQTSAKVPPWLWLWIVFYMMSLPQVFSLWQRLINDLLFYQEPSPEVTGSAFFFLARLGNLMEFIPSFALFLGTVSLLIPTLRKTWLERKFNLSDPPTSSLGITEIVHFIQTHAPGISIKVNPTEFSEYAFIYSLGYRKAAIAVFAPAIKLWRSDRSAAEALLLHEIAHYNHGDAFIVGAGSFFRAVIERWFYLFAGLFCLPIVIVFLTQTISFFQELGQLGWSILLIVPVLGAILHKIIQVIVGIPLLLGSMIGILLWTANIFTIPLIGIWTSELNADQFAAQRSSENMLNVIRHLPKEPRLIKWILSRLTHPPDWIRQWFITYSWKTFSNVLLLVLFPLSYILALILQIIFTMFQASVAGIPIESINLGDNIAYVMHNLFAPRWFVMSMLLVIWPFSAHIWERYFTERSQQNAQLESLTYFMSAAIVGGLSLIGFLMTTPS